MDIKCPLCGSRHSERLPLTWSKGKSHTTTNTVSVGGFWSLNKIGMVLFGSMVWPLALPLFLLKMMSPVLLFSRSWSTTQNVLSKQTEPPYRFPFWHYFWIGFALILIASQVTVFPAMIWHWSPSKETVYRELLTALAVVVVAVALWLGHLYNKEKWPLMEAEWQRSFMCKRCGGIFIVPEYDPVGVNRVASYQEGKKGTLLPQSHTQDQQDAVHAKAKGFDDVNLRKGRSGL